MSNIQYLNEEELLNMEFDGGVPIHSIVVVNNEAVVIDEYIEGQYTAIQATIFNKDTNIDWEKIKLLAFKTLRETFVNSIPVSLANKFIVKDGEVFVVLRTLFGDEPEFKNPEAIMKSYDFDAQTICELSFNILDIKEALM